MPNNELTHYGILGMRWGVRRSKAQLARARGSGTRRRVTKEEYEIAKKKAINSGDTKKVRAWKDHLSDDEFRKALNRVDLTQKLSAAEAKGKKSGLDAVEGVMNKIGQVTNIVNTGLNAYGVIAKINNTFSSKQLPAINGVNYKKQQAQADAADKKNERNENKERAKELLRSEDYATLLKDRKKYDINKSDLDKEVQTRKQLEALIKAQEEKAKAEAEKKKKKT